MARTFDAQLSPRACPDCGERFAAIQGTILNDGREEALYYIGLHGHETQAPAAKMNLILLQPRGKDVAATLTVFATEAGVAFRWEDWDAASDDERIAPLRTAAEARESPHGQAIFALAGEAIQASDEAWAYLSGPRGGRQ